jgi:hypothetical protein
LSIGDAGGEGNAAQADPGHAAIGRCATGGGAALRGVKGSSLRLGRS